MNASRCSLLVVALRTGVHVGVLPMLTVACAMSADPAESQVATDGTQGMMASTQSQSLASLVLDHVNVPNAAMAAAELSAPTLLWPTGCVTRARDATIANGVLITFTDCTGPFGLEHINGQETVAFSMGANGHLLAKIDGVGLAANGQGITHNATADVTFPSTGTRNVVWNGSFSRTNDAGETVAHNFDVQITVDLKAACHTSSGTAITTVADRTVISDLIDYGVCRDTTTGLEGCPSGTVVHTGRPSGKTVTVRFDGSATAQVTGPRGNTFEVPLVCTSIGH
jgi:hypothetical protein